MNFSAATRTSTALSAAAILIISGVVFAAPAAAATADVATGQELFDAIEAANATPGADTINLVGTSITLIDHLPLILDELTITGPGSAVLTVDAGSLYGAFHVTEAPLTLTGLTLSNTGDYAIYAQQATLVLDDIVVAPGANPTSCGLEVVSSNATITGSSFTTNCAWPTLETVPGNVVRITDSTFSSSAESGFSADLDGGELVLERVESNDNAIYGFDITADADASLAITDSSASDNGYGGFYIELLEDSTADVTNITSTDNDETQVELYALDDSSLTAAGITATGSAQAGITVSADTSMQVAVSDLVSTGNSPGLVVAAYLDEASVLLDGVLVNESPTTPGVFAFGAGTIAFTEATVIDNAQGGMFLINNFNEDLRPLAVSLTDSTVARNGTTDDANFGGIISFGADLTLDRTTVSANTAAEAAGILATSALTLINSTISGNSAGSSAAIVSSGPTTIEHSTITNNTSADTTSAVVTTSDSVTISHSIIASNGEDDLYTSGAPVINYSLVGAAEPSTLSALEAGTGNIVDTAPKLGPLANNGGLTETHLPTTGSPVIDAGDPSISGAPAIDQRGLQRIVRVIDLGAVEVAAVVPPIIVPPIIVDPPVIVPPGTDQPGTDQPGSPTPAKVLTSLPGTGAVMSPALALAALLLLAGLAMAVASTVRRRRI